MPKQLLRLDEPRIALLRGINVGGHHKVPMVDLRAVFGALGCSRVETLIQSGNVVFVDPSTELTSERVAAAIEDRFGFPVPVVLRSSTELAAALAAYPFGPNLEPKYTGVGFLEKTPDPEGVASMDPNRSPGDQFQVIGREVHLHYPNGSARSKLTVDWFQRSLKTTVTVRNLRSVGKLIELAETVAGSGE